VIAALMKAYPAASQVESSHSNIIPLHYYLGKPTVDLSILALLLPKDPSVTYLDLCREELDGADLYSTPPLLEQTVAATIATNMPHWITALTIDISIWTDAALEMILGAVAMKKTVTMLQVCVSSFSNSLPEPVMIFLANYSHLEFFSFVNCIPIEDCDSTTDERLLHDVYVSLFVRNAHRLVDFQLCGFGFGERRRSCPSFGLILSSLTSLERLVLDCYLTPDFVTHLTHGIRHHCPKLLL
jgi:hypothetical protein